MDTARIVARARSTLLTPKTEWPVIAAEPDTVGHLYSNYILFIAAIPAVIRFLTSSLIGIRVPLFGTYRVDIGTGLASAIVSYAVALLMIYVVALIVDALAPSFRAEKNRVQALKTIAYAYTASSVASIVGIIPHLAVIAALAGLVYAIYLLRVGLPFTMKCPDDSATGYTAVTIIAAIVVAVALGFVTTAILGPRFSLSPRAGAFTANSGFAIGKQSGDTADHTSAAEQALGTALGTTEKVESLPTDRMKSFIPDSLDGLKRTQISATRSGALGMQISTATGSYSDGAGRNLQLEITDTGSLKGFVGFAAGWAGVEQDNETDSGYDKTYQTNGQLVHEKWDRNSHQGQYGMIVAGRFAVSVTGTAPDINDFKTAVSSLNLTGLAALKNAGVHPN